METRELFDNISSEPAKQPFKWVMDLTASGRILIAGCSGSGKSVALKDIIYTLMAKDPDTNQFVFVDLKRVELRVFKNAPHTLAYVTEPEQVEKALNNVLTVIDQRYRIMEQHDQLVSSEPALWVIVDEYADLVTIGNKRIEKAIQRIAQIGRASRVFVILATQCPLSTIITTPIKANFSARLACRTVCQQDSRNILNGKTGAELLPKYGKAIMQVDGIDTVIDVPFLTQEELRARVQAWHNTPRHYRSESVQHRTAQDEAVIKHVLTALYGKNARY